MANKRVIDLPVLSQDVQEGQYILVDSSGGTGKMNLKRIVEEAGSFDPAGEYPDLYAGNLTTDKAQTDTAPYLLRRTGGNLSHVGVQCYPTLIGASVGENQLLTNTMFSNRSQTLGITITVNNDGSITVTGTATATNNLWFVFLFGFMANHVYLLKGSNGNGWLGISPGPATIDNGTGALYKFSSNDSRQIIYGFTEGVTYNETLYPEIIDLTQKLGSAIADYVYSLEQATAGSGIAWLRSYGFLSSGYVPYNAGTIESVEATAKVVRDENGENAVTYSLGNDILRGIFKLDANNQLYADGDRKEADGTITRRFGTRAYQSGDESLADAITDGTTTVYKLTTPTTETSTPFTSPQIVYPDGTEEFVTGNGLPVGHETEYPYDLKGLVEGLIDVPDVPSANGTYTLKATRSASGIVYNWVTG